MGEETQVDRYVANGICVGEYLMVSMDLVSFSLVFDSMTFQKLV